jgi:hypothetical protein
VVRKGIKEMKLPANQTLLLETLDFSDFVNEDPGLFTYRKDSYRNRANHFLSLKLMQGDSVLSSNIVSFVPPKYWPLKEPGIKYTLSRQQGKTKIVLSAEHFAAFVELGVYGSYAQFSDNYFHLLPGETKIVFVTSSEISDKKTRKGFFVRSLIDTYSNFNN